jgi:hypothetical protein
MAVELLIGAWRRGGSAPHREQSQHTKTTGKEPPDKNIHIPGIVLCCSFMGFGSRRASSAIAGMSAAVGVCVAAGWP